MENPETPTPLVVNSLQFYLGAEDIARIVNAILPILSKYLPYKTPDEQYVYLTTLVVKYSKNKTYGNKTELDSLVKDIVNKVATRVIVNPDDRCSGNQASNCKNFNNQHECSSHFKISACDAISPLTNYCIWDYSNGCATGNVSCLAPGCL